MHRIPLPRTALGAWTALAAVVLASVPCAAQAPPRPQLYVVTDVRTSDATDAPHVSLVLRGGRIESVLEAGAGLPPGARTVDGKGQLAVPAFIDAFTQAGCVTPVPKSDRDQPPSTRSDVQIDMREANRKGLQPAFRAVDVLDLAKDKSKGYREAGFGTILSAPQGQLLSGTSVLACTRDAAARDAVITADVFAHAAFRAAGPGYPGTPMGYVAQLRQFFLDAQRQRELEKRFAAGRPGLRPPFDADLEAASPMLARERRIVCEAQTARAIERWIKLADQFGLDIAIAGGREAWKVADVLAARRIPVILTLDWGEEVKDPHEKEKAEAKKKAEAEKKPKPPQAEKPAEEPKPPQEKPAEDTKPPSESKPAGEPKPPQESKPAAPPTEPAAKPAPETPPAPRGEGQQEPKPEPSSEAKPQEGEKKEGEKKGEKPDDKKAEEKKADDKKLWEYEEPLAVREEKRREWEEGRDCAIKLHAAGVTFAFGSAEASPADLAKRVRTLVESGLPADVALAGLTRTAAEIVGQGTHLGQLAPGFDATLALWTAPPLTKDAKLAWLFVDGFPHEFEIDKKDGSEGKPDEGVNATGTWELTTQRRGGDTRKSTAVLTMAEGGDVTGTIETKNAAGETDPPVDCKGHVGGKLLTLRYTSNTGGRESEVVIKATLEGDTMSGESTVKGGFGEFTSLMSGTRKPKRDESQATNALDDPESGGVRR